MATRSSIPSAFAGLARTASLGATGSYQHQISGRSRAGHARGARYVQVLVADYQPQDRPAACRAGFLIDAFTTSLLTGAGFGRRPFSHFHRVAVPSLAQSRKQAVGSSRLIACAYSRCAGSSRARDLSSTFHGSTRAGAHSLRNKPCFQHRAYALHFDHRLSSPLFSSGIDPNENGLTHAQAFFAFGANSSD